MKIKTNYSDNDLWCCFSKERIVIGEKYVEVKEKDSQGTYIKTYSLDNLPDELLDEDFPVNGDLG